ncbi:hypothetical protein T190607A01A_10935 [Tenacibaculum sp. 190524A05c]|uniref:Uncharacterized protein n=1 Tax=Tenacibaculum platacis TaxID=3137852 RepID=A0ABM9NUX3_9FLAO
MFDYILIIILAIFILYKIGKFLHLLIYGSEDDVKKYIDKMDDNTDFNIY